VRYVSTRGEAPILLFDDVLLAGLATDGGLYVPETWPRFDAADFTALEGLDYAETAIRVMMPYVADAISPADFSVLVRDSYIAFDHPEIAPLVPLGDDQYLLELFHGPTLAFKDYALQLVGRLFDFVLKRRGERVTIVGATSGDTGSAAIEACRDRDRVDIFILHPKGRVSEVQRRQMTTVTAANVHNIAIEGTFDDCQDLVKAMFADDHFRRNLKLSAVNSINWARVMAQIVYYVYAAVRLGAPEKAVSFAVPTGNFGNVFAGYAAYRMGLPIERLVVGSNRNDILTRYFESGLMTVEGVTPTLSPSMDIQISSNFERLLFDLYERDARAVATLMRRFRDTGSMEIEPARWKRSLKLFSGFRCDDEATRAAIADVYRQTDMLLDPHSAIGVAAGRAAREDIAGPMVMLATAHPAKFADAVEQATGVRPPLPPRLADLLDREEHYRILPNDLSAVQGFVRDHAAIAEEA